MPTDALILDHAVDRSPDLVHRVRRLHYFLHHFTQATRSIAAQEGVAIHVDRTEVARVFLEWTRELDSQRHFAKVDRRDYIFFGAGLLLRRLLASKSFRIESENARAKKVFDSHETLFEAWPEGYLATTYCLTVLDAVLQQECCEPLALPRWDSSLRTWYSYKENCLECSDMAIPFLDYFAGNEPNWVLPTSAYHRSRRVLIG